MHTFLFPRRLKVILRLFKFSLKEYIILFIIGLLFITVLTDILENNITKDGISQGVRVDTVDLIRQIQLNGNKDILMFNCSKIADIEKQNSKQMDSDDYKQVFRSIHDGEKIVIKMVTQETSYVRRCQKRELDNSEPEKENSQQCFTAPHVELMKEISVLQGLSHPNLVKLLGFCIPN